MTPTGVHLTTHGICLKIILYHHRRVCVCGCQRPVRAQNSSTGYRRQTETRPAWHDVAATRCRELFICERALSHTHTHAHPSCVYIMNARCMVLISQFGRPQSNKVISPIANGECLWTCAHGFAAQPNIPNIMSLRSAKCRHRVHTHSHTHTLA